MDDTLEKIMAVLRVPGNPRGRALIGFDGYIDRVVRLKKSQRDPPEYFESIGDFSGFLRSYPGKSMDIGIRRISEKIGGNGPLMAESLAVKDVKTCCIGAFGYPGISDIFKALAEKCTLISVEQPAFAMALEFNDAKLMLGENEPLDHIDWEKLMAVMEEEEIYSRIDESEIIGFTNWSGLSKSNDILKGLVRSVCPRLGSKKKILFFDLADPSCKTEEQFEDFFELLKELSGPFDITLGLNAKETVLVYNRFFRCREEEFTDAMIAKLAEAMPVKEVVVHGPDWAAASEAGNKYGRIRGIKAANPRVLTGAGDNFNAGYCLGKLYSLDITACLYLGNISASFYVKNGFPAGISDILKWLTHSFYGGTS